MGIAIFCWARRSCWMNEGQSELCCMIMVKAAVNVAFAFITIPPAVIYYCFTSLPPAVFNPIIRSGLVLHNRSIRMVYLYM